MLEKKSSNHPFEEFSINGSSFLNAININDYSTSIDSFHHLSEEDRLQAIQLASQLEIMNYENILKFGTELQHSLKNFTNHLLVRVQRHDTSPIREILNKLVAHLEMIDPDDLIESDKGFFKKIFHRAKSSIQEIVSQYNRLSKQIDRLSIQLQHAQKGLLTDIKLLNELFDLNKEYFDKINLYIAAGQLKKSDLLNTVLPEAENQANLSADPMEQQHVQDLKNAIEWLDKRIYELQITREIAIQTAPQIRMIQQTNQLLIEKIQTSVLTTIPLWQTQISMLVSLNNQRRADITTRRLIDTSEQMMTKNAKMIEQTAKNAKKVAISHSDIDRFKQTQLQLIQSIEDSLRVQAISNEQQSTVEAKILEIDQVK